MGVPTCISEINHTCSTTCRYWPTSDSNYWKVVYNWQPNPPSSLSPINTFWFPETPQFSTTCTWTWHDELLSYTDFQASFNSFKIILLVDSSVIMGSHQPLLLWYLVFHMQGLILGPHWWLLYHPNVSITWQPSCHLCWWYFTLLPYIISCRLQADINSLNNNN